jgi:hypothetical protein
MTQPPQKVRLWGEREDIQITDGELNEVKEKERKSEMGGKNWNIDDR